MRFLAMSKNRNISLVFRFLCECRGPGLRIVTIRFVWKRDGEGAREGRPEGRSEERSPDQARSRRPPPGFPRIILDFLGENPYIISKALKETSRFTLRHREVFRIGSSQEEPAGWKKTVGSVPNTPPEPRAERRKRLLDRAVTPRQGGAKCAGERDTVPGEKRWYRGEPLRSSSFVS